MKQDEFKRILEEASGLVERGRLEDAEDLMRPLLEARLADADKVMVAINLATVAERRADLWSADRYYDRAVDYERGSGRTFAAEHRAAAFVRRGRPDEAISAYRVLLSRGDLDEETRGRIEHNIATLS